MRLTRAVTSSPEAILMMSRAVSRFRLSQDLAARPHASFGISDGKNHTKTVLNRLELASFRFQAQQKIDF
jgi:hypothetical protein